MFRAIKRVFIWLGLMAEKATETDAINEAVVERGIRDSKAKADKAHYANGQLAGITSWGAGCGRPHSPGAYTRVATYTNLIRPLLL